MEENWKPKRNDLVWMPDPASDQMVRLVVWRGVAWQKMALLRGMIMKTQESALEISKKMYDVVL